MKKSHGAISLKEHPSGSSMHSILLFFSFGLTNCTAVGTLCRYFLSLFELDQWLGSQVGSGFIFMRRIIKVWCPGRPALSWILWYFLHKICMVCKLSLLLLVWDGFLPRSGDCSKWWIAPRISILLFFSSWLLEFFVDWGTRLELGLPINWGSPFWLCQYHFKTSSLQLNWNCSQCLHRGKPWLWPSKDITHMINTQCLSLFWNPHLFLTKVDVTLF